MVHTHRPSYERGFGTAVQVCGPKNQVLAEAGNLGDILWCVLQDRFLKLCESRGVLFDIVPINQSGADQNMDQSIN